MQDENKKAVVKIETDPKTPAITEGTETSQTQKQAPQPPTKAQEGDVEPQQEVYVSVLKEEDEKSLRCGVCGRHIVSIITHHAVVRGTCQRKNCKKINEFHVQGNKIVTEVHEKPRVERFQ